MSTSKKPSVATETATAFLDYCARNGLTARLKTTPGVVAVEKSFTAGDDRWYCVIEMDANSALDLLNAKGGSRWGSDSGGIGGAIAIKRGEFVLNQSGVPLRVIAALRKTGKCIEG